MGDEELNNIHGPLQRLGELNRYDTVEVKCSFKLRYAYKKRTNTSIPMPIGCVKDENWYLATYYGQYKNIFPGTPQIYFKIKYDDAPNKTFFVVRGHIRRPNLIKRATNFARSKKVRERVRTGLLPDEELWSYLKNNRGLTDQEIEEVRRRCSAIRVQLLDRDFRFRNHKK